MGDTQTWNIAATPRQRFGFLRAILQREETPKPKGSQAMRVRDRFRRALGLNEIMAAMIAAEAQGINGMPLINTDCLTDVPEAFEVTAENSDELEAILKEVAPSEGDQVALASIIFGLIDRKPCDPSVPKFGIGSQIDWMTPKDWRDRIAAKTKPKPGETRCPQCANCFVPTEPK